MTETEAQLMMPAAALKALEKAGPEGMTAGAFFEICRDKDGVENPLLLLKRLRDSLLVDYIEGTRPLRVIKI